jgi:hypothetical protein
MSTAIVDGNLGRWKIRVRKRTHGNAHELTFTVLGVENSSPTNRAEPECEPGSLIPDTNIFGRGTEDLEGSGEAGQCRENTARPVLAGQTVANTHSAWLTFDLDTKLPAGAGGCSGRH